MGAGVMARKSLGDLSGIAKAIANSGPTAAERARTTAPALGALQGALSAIREIEPDQVDDWGPQDRMGEFTAVNDEDGTGLEALKSSIAESGQQVPILVRRAPEGERYQVIYGRRRLRACRELGLKVRANVQDLDDAAALLAKGLENAARRNLSFYEKARFAELIQSAGHDTKTARAILGLTASGLSHLTKVTDKVPDLVGDEIGAAPKAGRPKWTALADAFAAGKITQERALTYLASLPTETQSEDRLDRLLKETARRGTRDATPREIQPMNGVTIKSAQNSLSLTVKKSGHSASFARWLEANLEDIVSRSYQEFTSVSSEPNGKSRKE